MEGRRKEEGEKRKVRETGRMEKREGEGKRRSRRNVSNVAI